MKITAGRTVLYVLSEEDAIQINRRRTTGPAIAERIALKVSVEPRDHGAPPQHHEPQYAPLWPIGAQAHIGNAVKAGDTFPAVAVRVWGDGENPPVNFQVMLDGTDTYWATSRHEDEMKMDGTWHWPPRA